MASTIRVLSEPERVNLVVRTLKPDYLLLDIFLHLRSETSTQWTIEAARVKVYHRPYSFENGPVVYPANAFDSRLQGELVPLGSIASLTKSQEKDFSGWRPAIAFLYFFLFHSLLRLTSFLSQYKNVTDFDPKGTISEVRLHPGANLDILDASQSSNLASVHVGTTQVDFELDRPPPADSPPGYLLIAMVKQTVIRGIKEFWKLKESETSSYLSLIWKGWKLEMTARLPVTVSSVETWFYM